MSKDITPIIYTDISHAEQDKIIKLCTTYGLNEEETKQLISQLQVGDDNSTPIDRKLVSIMSAKNQEMSFNDSDFKFGSQYSFKPIVKNGTLGIQSQQHSFQKVLMNKMKHQQDKLEQLEQLRQQNQLLLREKIQLQNKVNFLLEAKSQESEIIVGLKNAVCTLTNLLKDKQQAYMNLHENYQKLFYTLQQNTARENYYRPEKDYLKKTDQKFLKQTATLQNQPMNMQRRQSKQLLKTKSSQNINQKVENSRPSLKLQQNIPQNKQQKQKAFIKKPKLDMNKYKVFVDELKNICANKPQRI